MKKPASKLSVIESPAPEPTPDWVVLTPWESEYELVMSGNDGQPIQSVQMTREEFVDLKHYLAGLRGYGLHARSVDELLRQANNNCFDVILPDDAPATASRG